MKLRIVTASMFVTMCLHGQESILRRAAQLEEEGKFKEAATELQKPLTENYSLNSAERKKLEFELDRLERIKQDYSMTKDRLYTQIEKSIRGVTQAEFERWIAEGKFDIRMIDGVQYFVSVSRSNLFWRYPEIAARRINPPDESAFERAVWESCVAIKKASSNRQPYVLPKSFKTVMKVKVKVNAVPAGETVRAWLPIPRKFAYQKDFQLVSSSAVSTAIADEESNIRSAYMEQVSVKDQPTEFKIEFTYTILGIHFKLTPEEVQPFDPADPTVRNFTREGPHVVFTDKMKKLSDQITGKEKNSLVKARKFYDWITENIKYSYALEYSTIRNIGEYCLDKMYGDCGQEALLFITLAGTTGSRRAGSRRGLRFPEEKRFTTGRRSM